MYLSLFFSVFFIVLNKINVCFIKFKQKQCVPAKKYLKERMDHNHQSLFIIQNRTFVKVSRNLKGYQLVVNM